MTHSRSLLVFSMLLIAGFAWAACPIDGFYSTTDVLLPGVASESEPTGQSGELGNAVYAESWDGVSLGTQWILSCPAICVEPVLVESDIDACYTARWDKTIFGDNLFAQAFLNGNRILRCDIPGVQLTGWSSSHT